MQETNYPSQENMYIEEYNKNKYIREQKHNYLMKSKIKNQNRNNTQSSNKK
ncbi:hypothetical protein Bca4012_016366 [Brassica carinata]